MPKTQLKELTTPTQEDVCSLQELYKNFTDFLESERTQLECEFKTIEPNNQILNIYLNAIINNINALHSTVTKQDCASLSSSALFKFIKQIDDFESMLKDTVAPEINQGYPPSLSKFLNILRNVYLWIFQVIHPEPIPNLTNINNKNEAEPDWKKWPDYKQGFKNALDSTIKREKPAPITLEIGKNTFTASIELITYIAFIRGITLRYANGNYTSFWRALKRKISNEDPSYLINQIIGLTEFMFESDHELSALAQELIMLKRFLSPQRQGEQ